MHTPNRSVITPHASTRQQLAAALDPHDRWMPPVPVSVSQSVSQDPSQSSSQLMVGEHGTRCVLETAAVF